MMRVALASALALLTIVQTAAAAEIRFRFKVYGDYTDAGAPLKNDDTEDYWTVGSAAQLFRGGRYQIRLGSSSGTILADGYLGDGISTGTLATSAIITLANVNQTYWYKLYSKVDVNQNIIWGRLKSSGNYCYKTATKTITGGAGTYDVTISGSSADCQDVFRALSASAFSMYRHNGGVSDETFTVYVRGSCGNTTSGLTTCLGDTGSNRKFTVSHEMGHALSNAIDDEITDGDCSYNDSAKCAGGTASTAHAMYSKEKAKCAVREAFAHFYAADTYNSHGSHTTCAFNYYKDYTPASPDLGEQVVDCSSYYADRSALESTGDALGTICIHGARWRLSTLQPLDPRAAQRLGPPTPRRSTTCASSGTCMARRERLSDRSWTGSIWRSTPLSRTRTMNLRMQQMTSLPRPSSTPGGTTTSGTMAWIIRSWAGLALAALWPVFAGACSSAGSDPRPGGSDAGLAAQSPDCQPAVEISFEAAATSGGRRVDTATRPGSHEVCGLAMHAASSYDECLHPPYAEYTSPCPEHGLWAACTACSGEDCRTLDVLGMSEEPDCFCLRQCQRSSDCGRGQFCICALDSDSMGGHPSRCVPGNCQSDADCPTGERCWRSTQHDDGMQACSTPEDECVPWVRCTQAGGRRGLCLYVEGRWSCQPPLPIQ